MKIQPVRHCCFILLVLICLPLTTSAGRKGNREIEYTIPSVSLTLLSEKPLTIGDPIDLALTVYHERKDVIVYPEEDDAFAPFMLRDRSMKRKKVGPREVKTIVLYTISVFQTGDVSLSPLTIEVGDVSLQTEQLTLAILSVLPADETEPELMDIVPPYRARIRSITVIIILLGIAVAFGLFIVVRKYLIHPRAIPKTVVESDVHFDPYEYSIRKLESIRKEHAREQADLKKVYSTISHTLKLFFGSLFTIQALEMTTSELKRYLRRSGARHDQYLHPNRLINILHRSDMVKFARENPPHGNVERDIDQSITIIKEAQVKIQEAYRPAAQEAGDGV
jgi:hypothetical protein